MDLAQPIILGVFIFAILYIAYYAEDYLRLLGVQKVSDELKTVTRRLLIVFVILKVLFSLPVIIIGMI